MTGYERIEWISGVRVTTRETSLALDPANSRRFDKRVHQFISHAHADHTQCLSTRGVKYATTSTKKIYEGIRKKPIMDFNEIKVNHSIRLADVEVTPINAGHMLGSIQLRITTPNKTLLYTGDLNCIDTLTTDRAESVECDLLVIEATFGNPYYIFPDRESTYAKIVEWATRQAKKQYIPTFHVYAAGKAQEIVKLFNLYTKLPVLVSPPVAAANEAYNSEGIKLRYETVDNGCEDDLFKSGPCVYVTTPSDRLIPEKCERAVATGWALGTANRFPAFPLSSHADFKQLIEFVKSTRAKTVYIFTGYSDFFASYLQNRYGIDARPIRSVAQKTLEISQ